MNRFAWAVVALSCAAPLGAEDVKVFTPSRTGDSPVYMNGDVVRIDRAAGTITVRGSDGTQRVMTLDRSSLEAATNLRAGSSVIVGFRTSGSGTTERHVVSDIRGGPPIVARRTASSTASGARTMGTAQVVSVDAAGRRLTVIDSTGATRVLDVRGSALASLAGLNAGDQISLGVAAPLVSGTPAGTVTSIGSGMSGSNTAREGTNASGGTGDANVNGGNTAPGRTNSTTGGNTVGNATTGTNAGTGGNVVAGTNATGTNATGTDSTTGTNSTTATNQGNSTTQSGNLSFQPRPGDTTPPTGGPQGRTGERNTGVSNTNTPAFNNGSLPNSPTALPQAPRSGLGNNPAQTGVQPAPGAQPLPGVQGPTGVQPAPGAQPLPGTGTTGQGAANPGLSTQPVPGAAGQNGNNSGAAGGTGAATASRGGGGTAVGGTTNAIPQLGGIPTSAVNSQIPSIPQAGTAGTTTVLPVPSVNPESNPPQTPAEVSAVREMGSRDFDLAVATLAARAAEVDRAWVAYRSGCVTTSVALNNRPREWFGLLDGSINEPTDDTCGQSFAEVDRLARSVNAGLETVRDAARRADVLPGRMREVLQRYNLDI